MLLTTTTTSLTLPNDLLWDDEFSYTPIVQQERFSLTGAQVIEEGKKLSGRKISLIATSDQYSWVSKTIMDDLLALVNRSVLMTLTLPDTRVFTVRFRHNDTPIDATPVVHYEVMANELYILKALRFMETAV